MDFFRMFSGGHHAAHQGGEEEEEGHYEYGEHGHEDEGGDEGGDEGEEGGESDENEHEDYSQVPAHYRIRCDRCLAGFHIWDVDQEQTPESIETKRTECVCCGRRVNFAKWNKDFTKPEEKLDSTPPTKETPPQ